MSTELDPTNHPEVGVEGSADLGVTNLEVGTIKRATLAVDKLVSTDLVAGIVRETVLTLPEPRRAIVAIDPALASPLAPRRLTPTFVYAATLLRWVDGDTCDVLINLGFCLTIEQRVRVNGLDTPERGHPLHDAAWERARALAPEGSTVTLRTHKPVSEDKYGRFLADVQRLDGLDVTATLIAEGLGKPYHGGTKNTW